MEQLPEFESVIVLYEPLIKKFLAKYGLLSEFDEYRQIAWIALWQAYSNFNPEKGPFPAYASAVIRGRLLTEMKRRKQYKVRFELKDQINDKCTYQPSNAFEMDWHFSFLSPREKLWLQAAIIEGFGTKDIAKRYGVTQDTVRSWKKSAVKKLKQQLTLMGFEKKGQSDR